MKEFITGVAALLLISVFLMQFTTNQILHNEMIFVQKDIDTFVQEIKEAGGADIGNDITNRLKKNIKKDLGKSYAGDATVVITTESGAPITSPLKRGLLIYFEISYDMKNTVAGKGFFGISDDTVHKKFTGATASEYKVVLE